MNIEHVMLSSESSAAANAVVAGLFHALTASLESPATQHSLPTA